MSCKIYIATSLDGYIADENNSIEWLNIIPFTQEIQNEFDSFIENIDCIIMGKNTFETVISFDEWPYKKEVFVLSNSMKNIPNKYENKAKLVNEKNMFNLINLLKDKGYKNFYIDGGTTIQNFLKENLIDEMIITTIPIILGSGKSLFCQLSNSIEFRLIKSKILSNCCVQSTYGIKE